MQEPPVLIQTGIQTEKEFQENRGIIQYKEIPVKEVQGHIHINLGQGATIIHIIRQRVHILLLQDLTHHLPDLIRLPAGRILRRDQAAVQEAAVEEAAEVLQVEGDNIS